MVPSKSAASAALEARLETANPSDADLRKNNRRGGGGGGGTDRGAQEHQVEHISLSVLEGSFLQEKIHQVFPILTSVEEQEKEKRERRKASAGGRGKALSLLYPSRSIHLVGLIKCQVEFLDI